MSDDKLFNLAKLLGSQADKFGYKLGGKLPSVLESLLSSLIKKGQLGENLEEMVPGAHALISKGIEFLGNVFELPKDEVKKLIPGFLGDVVYEAFNEAIDAMGRGAGDAPKEGKKPTEESGSAEALDPGMMKGFVVGGQLHKSNCTTAPRPRAFKGEKSPEDITVRQAVERRHALSYCGCWGTTSAVDQLEAQVKALVFATSTATEVEVPPETPELKIEKPKGSLYVFLKRFSEEEPLLFMEIVDGAFRPITARDHGLKVKFYKAFDNSGTYEDFLYVLKSPNEHWHVMLDDLIGEPKRDQSTFKRELAEFARMFDALIEQMEKVPAWCKGVSDASKRRTKAFKAECAARDAKRTRNAKATKYVVSFIALAGLITFFFINPPF
ncbi:MAG: hypothetical protein WC866_04625 [Patescibacteria group bacterium]|jgi:hypothetical protein